MKTSKYKLPLATINHSWLDRVKLGFSLINPKFRWSMGPKVEEVEKALAQKTGYKYCVATSSGSTANTLLAMWESKKLISKKKVIFPAIAWSTTVSPWIDLGFEPVFIDVREDFPIMDENKLIDYFLDYGSDDVAAVFYVPLLGNRRNLESIKSICDGQLVRLYLDSCEDTFGIKSSPEIEAETTSFYLAHEIQACPEMGAIFTNDLSQYEYYVCARNHGMIRTLENPKTLLANSLVDRSFDFAVSGNNFRPTELSAYAVLLDMKRWDEYIEHRCKMEFVFSSNNCKAKGILKLFLHNDIYNNEYIPFCIPVFSRAYDQRVGDEVSEFISSNLKARARRLGIEIRPIVGSNLLRQTCFRRFGDYEDYPNAEWFTKYGFYFGIPKKITKEFIEFCDYKEYLCREVCRVSK